MYYTKILGGFLLIFGGMYLGSKVKIVDAIIIGLTLIIGSALFNIDT